ncbi:LLM class flavin-dependent oxidoreductase [Rhodococcus sp. NPDC060176]|uniref:LLM class flavin-dependent oxidoreductase n=1 Tax=Rhodococcus sp. NPDC060176 TaxID=3347062 RepID=UPI003663A790
MSKRIRLNAVTVNGPTVSPGLWAHPDDHAHEFTSLDYWIRLARTLERGLFDAVFFADMLGLYDVYQGSADPALAGAIQVPIHDPTYLVPAMAEVTEHLGFAVTVSTSYENPYTVARTLSTLDVLTEGRIGWNIVTSNLDSAAKLHGLPTQFTADDRYARGEEFLEVTYKLWENSWEDDAVVVDKARRIYTDPERVHGIDHHGERFSVPGVHTVAPTPQRTPMLFQAGSSERGRQFAATHAEAIFLNTPTKEATKFIIDDVRRRAEESGRDPQSVLFFPKITPIVADNTADARRRFDDFLKYSSTDGIFTLLGAWTGIDFAEAREGKLLSIAEKADSRGLVESLKRHNPGIDVSADHLAQVFAFGTSALTIGSPAEVADELEEFIDSTGADGFNVASVVQPGTIDDFIDHVIPELQKRGRVQTEYAEGTLREKVTGSGPRLPEDHPGSTTGFLR